MSGKINRSKLTALSYNELAAPSKSGEHEKMILLRVKQVEQQEGQRRRRNREGTSVARSSMTSKACNI